VASLSLQPLRANGESLIFTGAILRTGFSIIEFLQKKGLSPPW
jgi:hypothetical protein